MQGLFSVKRLEKAQGVFPTFCLLWTFSRAYISSVTLSCEISSPCDQYDDI